MSKMDISNVSSASNCSDKSSSFFDTSQATVINRGIDYDLNAEALKALEESLQAKLDKMTEEMENMDKKYRSEFNTTEEYITEVRGATAKINEETAVLKASEKIMIGERDQAVQDLRDVEQAFSDVHRKYERAKQTVQKLKVDEDQYIKRDHGMQRLLSTRNEQSTMFTTEAADTVEKLFEDCKGRLEALTNEGTRLSANLRRSEMRNESLQFELHQKQEENKQLNTLVDELIEKQTY